MKILVDLTCCEKGHSYGVYAFRVLSVWREYNSSNVDIILLIKGGDGGMGQKGISGGNIFF